MAFVKLDTKILNSTIWMDADACKLFITALLMAEPFEVVTPLQTVKVHSTEWDDFIVPPGWYGYVPAAGPGIARQALMEWEPTGIEALKRLASPESASRTAAFDGRRMVRVDGGYLILNYISYRDRDHSNAERQARFRARKKGGVTLPSQSNTVIVTPVTHAYEDVDVDADAEKSKSKKNQKQEPARGSRLPDDWYPTEALLVWARSERPDLVIANAIDSFVDYWRGVAGAKGRKLDWTATFRNWIRDQRGFTGKRPEVTVPSKTLQFLQKTQAKINANHANELDSGRDQPGVYEAEFSRVRPPTRLGHDGGDS